MKTKSEHFFPPRTQECGNALIYVLIAIALFAALSFTLMGQTDSSESNSLSDEKAELYATQLITYASQTRSSVDQMLFTASTSVGELDFTLPSDAGFNTGTLIHKIYHPQGGGLNIVTLPDSIKETTSSDPVAGWYLGRFNNVEWTGAGNDVILTAYQINEKVCGLINKKVNGSTAIPTITAPIKNVMIDDTEHTGTNVELTTDGGDICPDCANVASLCVHEGGIYGFYTIIADQ